MQKQLIRLLIAVSLLCAVPGVGLAASDQFSNPKDVDLTKLLNSLSIPGKEQLAKQFEAPKTSPVTTFGTPTAYGANWGQAFIGVSGIHYLDNDNDAIEDTDGSLSFGMGFGNAVDTVGLEVNVAIISMRTDFGDSGSVGAKIHKVFPGAGGLGIAVGYDNVASWGDAEDAEDTLYAVLSKDFQLGAKTGLPVLSVSLGVGSGTFRSKDTLEDEYDDNNANVFGSLGLMITPQFSVATSWTGSQLNAGIGLVPFASVPLSVSAGIGDVTEEFDAGRTFLMNVGYAINF